MEDSMSDTGEKGMAIQANILIVDDQPDNIRTLSAMLKQEGYKIRQALSGTMALKSMQAFPPDLVLLDIRMPYMDGYEVCSVMKETEATREIPVIFLSALNDISDKVKAFTIGATDYITKPFQTEEVLLRVQHQLTIRHQRQQLIAQNYQLQQEIQERQRAETLIHQQFQREQLLAEMIRYIRQSLHLNEILQIAVNEIRQSLQTDRVLICRFYANHISEIVAEAVGSTTRSLLHPSPPPSTLQTHPWNWHLLCPDQQISVIADVQGQFVQPDVRDFLADLQVQASLTIPIPQTEDQLWGLLVVHHCTTSRVWEPWEIDFLHHITEQLAIAIEQSELYHTLETQVQERTTQLRQALEFETRLKHITDKVRDSLDEQQILQAAVEELISGLDIECCETGLYDEDLSCLIAIYRYGACSSAIIEAAVPQYDTMLCPQLLQREAVQFCQYFPVPTNADEESYTILVCPIFDDLRLLGNLWLFKTREALFDDLEVRLAKQVANQCAIALRQARLYQAAQTQVQELQRLNQLKDDFLSTVSHELRSPIANIKMVIRLLTIAMDQAQRSATASIPSPESEGRIRKYLDILQEECERELHLVQDLLDLQQLEAGTHPLQASQIRFQTWLPHRVEVFAPRLQAQEHQLILDIDPELPDITSDLFCLDRIISELLDNACKYSPPHQTITVAAKREGEFIAISVRNSGVEIPREELHRVFDKFYRIPSQDPWKHSGTGLGLALVRRMVEYLGGSIHASSGSGQTNFMVVLPGIVEEG